MLPLCADSLLCTAKGLEAAPFSVLGCLPSLLLLFVKLYPGDLVDRLWCNGNGKPEHS